MYYILLDTPFNPSVLEPGVEYSKMFISWMTVDMVNQYITLGLEFGETDGYGNEIKGTYSQTLKHRIDTTPVPIYDGYGQIEDYDMDGWTWFCSRTATEGEYMVEEFQYYLLEKLIDDGTVQGTIVQEG